ncbi:Mth938-like domain-containing protein [Thermodesulfobacteriota bacterium B35]
MITDYEFGRMRINATWYTRDLLIKEGVVLPQWWRQSGHVCDVADLQPLLEDSVEVIVLGSGNPGLMRPSDTLRDFLRVKDIELIVQPTREAIHTFNELLGQGRKVGAGFHLTC